VRDKKLIFFGRIRLNFEKGFFLKNERKKGAKK